MKGISKNKRGISLIVLVITIIVMIILASAIILSLRSSGIIGRANEAKTKSDIANAKEVVSLAYAEWELDQASLKGTYSNFSAYATAKLVEAGFDTESMYITEEGELVTGPAAFFTKNNIAIGTEVTGYDLSSNKTISYTTDGKENTAPDNTETDPTAQTVARGTELVWKYMGIDENGNALIVADSTGTLSAMQLSGTGGYVNGPAALDTACAALYSSDMGTARSMDFEDVTRILKYEGHQGTYYDTDYNEIKTDKALSIGEIETKLGTTLLLLSTPDGSNIANFKSDYVNLPKTSTDIKAGNIEKNLVYQSTEYWLSSSCACGDFLNSDVSFYVRTISNESMGGCMLFDSIYASFCNSYAVRPVVSLTSNVQVAYDGTTVTLLK